MNYLSFAASTVARSQQIPTSSKTEIAPYCTVGVELPYQGQMIHLPLIGK